MNKLDLAESLLKLWRMSQSFETENEQILPFCPHYAEDVPEGSVENPADSASGDGTGECQQEREEKAVKVLSHTLQTRQTFYMTVRWQHVQDNSL